MNSDVIPSGSALGGASSGRSVSWGVARQVRRDLEVVSGRGEVAQATDQARALVTAGALHNMAGLVGLARECMETAPEGGPFYEAILRAYGVGAARAIADFQ